MKIKDSTVITLLIFVTMLIFIGVIGTENEMDRMEKQINEVYEHEMENLRRISALEDIPDRVAYLEKMSQFHQDRLDYLSDTIALNKSESSTRFDDLLHEVNAYEEAVNGLSVAQIKMPTTWHGAVLSKSNGVVIGPSGRETYYNMDMSFCVRRMRSRGYSERDYPYWVRNDGCKMLGQFVMVAANFRIRPLGTILETSRGWAIVVDTGGFVNNYPKGIDVATNW